MRRQCDENPCIQLWTLWACMHRFSSHCRLIAHEVFNDLNLVVNVAAAPASTACINKGATVGFRRIVAGVNFALSSFEGPGNWGQTIISTLQAWINVYNLSVSKTGQLFLNNLSRNTLCNQMSKKSKSKIKCQMAIKKMLCNQTHPAKTYLSDYPIICDYVALLLKLTIRRNVCMAMLRSRISFRVVKTWNGYIIFPCAQCCLYDAIQIWGKLGKWFKMR